MGSDLDVIVVVSRSNAPFERRSVEWDVSTLPVPTDLIVYTQEECDRLDPESRFARMFEEEAVWVYRETREDGGIVP